MKTFSFLICISFLIITPAWSQNMNSLRDAADSSIASNFKRLYNPNYLKLSAEVKYIDSQYVLIPHLQVLEKDSVIQLHKNLNYTNQNSPNPDLYFEVERQVGCMAEAITLDAIREPEINDDYGLYKDYKYGSSLTDSIYLDDFCALEVGKYQLFLLLHYYKNGVEGEIELHGYEFDIPFESKKGMWQSCKY